MRGAPATSVSVVKLVFLARLREAFGARTSASRSTRRRPSARSARASTRAAAPWAAELAPARAVRIAVNHELARDDAPVSPGDEVAFFPPVTGG
jgi:molybdopterin synthase sulfur carrier subunit